MKVVKWLLGLLAGIGGILAIVLGSSKSKKKVRELNKKIDDSNKTVKKTKKEIKKVESKLKDKKKKLNTLKDKKNNYKRKDVGLEEASDFLKRYANKDKK